jgi:hypothetical protein
MRQIRELAQLVEHWNSKCEEERRRLGGRTMEEAYADLAKGRLK